jgi:putative ABC transport system ATP-binding protein
MENVWLKTIGLCRYYHRGPQVVHAVDDVNLTLHKGEFLGIVGASGSGKSTLLNLMAGLDTPTSGRIEINGVSLAGMNRRSLAAYRAHRVGMVFQSFNLISHHTALKNVELALLFNNTPGRERRRIASAMLGRLGLGDRLTHRPGDLSGGEQQRVAIARALVKQPEIIFADEPTGNLDHDNARQIGDLLTGLNREGLTIIMVTHDLEMAARYARRTIRMNYGALVDGQAPPESEGRS